MAKVCIVHMSISVLLLRISKTKILYQGHGKYQTYRLLA